MKDQSTYNTTTTTSRINRTPEFMKSFLGLLSLSDTVKDKVKRKLKRTNWNEICAFSVFCECPVENSTHNRSFPVGLFHIMTAWLTSHTHTHKYTHSSWSPTVFCFFFQIRSFMCWTLQDQYKDAQGRLFIHKCKQKSLLMPRILTLLSPQSFTKSASVTDKM